MSVAAVLLAAGRSMRFGSEDKIAAMLGDVPLGHHAARTLRAVAFDARIVVAAPRSIAWPGFTVVRNEAPKRGQAGSIALGVGAARRLGADAVLIALADMPFVSAAHVRRLVARHRSPDTIVASSSGAASMPPALFGAAWFDRLTQLDGDRGARALLDGADIVIAPADELLDIDDPSDLAAARRRVARCVDDGPDARRSTLNRNHTGRPT